MKWSKFLVAIYQAPTWYVPGIAPGIRDTAVNEANRKLCIHGAYTEWNKIKITNKI